MSGYGMLMTTMPDKPQAAAMAKYLLAERLAACVQLVPIESHYIWQGAIQEAGEYLLLVKTRAALFEAAIDAIKARHPYDVPEITVGDFSAGFAGYLRWIDDVTK
jgi:periplasmic divalent cation tolerance protein